MRTIAVNREDPAVDIEESQMSSGDGDGQAAAGRQVFERGDSVTLQDNCNLSGVAGLSSAVV